MRAFLYLCIVKQEYMAIVKEISTHDWQEIKLANLKCHVIGPVDNSNIVRDTWTSFGGATNPFVKIDKESYGSVFNLAPDKSSFIVTIPCLFEFAGCVHFVNNTGSTKTIRIGSRILKNGNSEAKCSQVFYSNDVKQTNGEMTLKYTGTDVTHKPNEYFNLQYYLYTESGLDIDFTTDDAFENQVAATLYVKAIGLPSYTAKNEKIEWHITP
jgi:hypothetical protein